MTRPENVTAALARLRTWTGIQHGQHGADRVHHVQAQQLGQAPTPHRRTV